MSDGLPAWGVTVVTIAAIAFIVLAGIYLTRPIFRFIHATRLREMYTALALAIVVGISFLMSLVGLSPALGAFLAGVVLANSEFRHELESDLEPFKGLFLGLFFITVGAGINYQQLFAEPLDLLGLALLVALIKGLVLFVLALIFQLKRRDKWLFTPWSCTGRRVRICLGGLFASARCLAQPVGRPVAADHCAVDDDHAAPVYPL